MRQAGGTATLVAFVAAAFAALAPSGTARAEDLVKVAIGQRGNWDTAIPHVGEKAGIFKKHGLSLEPVSYTHLTLPTIYSV